VHRSGVPWHPLHRRQRGIPMYSYANRSQIRALRTSEKDAKLAQKLGQLQPFMAVFLLECMGQLVSFGPA
jgi:hypothetical protein